MIERGEGNPSWSKLERVLTALGLEVSLKNKKH
jgi:hypothetical protein